MNIQLYSFPDVHWSYFMWNIWSADVKRLNLIESVTSMHGLFFIFAQTVCYRSLKSFHENATILKSRGVTIRLATIRYISRYTTHDMVHDTIQNQLIYYQWKILKHCGMCHQYCYIKTVILARNSEFKINKDVHNHPCPKYLLLTNCVCKQNNKIS